MILDIDLPLWKPTDPPTSRAAGLEIRPHLSRLVKWAAECVRQTPGRTRMELAKIHSPDDHNRVGRRLREAERQGLVKRGPARRCSCTGKSATTWEPVTP